MKDVLVGVAAMAVGGLLCFKGTMATKVVLSLWGGLVGFLLGAAVMNQENYLQSGSAWLVGALFALVLAALTYALYEVAMVVLLGGAGFFLAAAVIIVLGLEWSWLTVLIVSLVGVVAGLYSYVNPLPKVAVVIAAALSGASVFTVGTMVLLGVTKLNELGTGVDVQRLRDSWAWLVVVGLVGAYAVYVQWTDANASLTDRKNWVMPSTRK